MSFAKFCFMTLAVYHTDELNYDEYTAKFIADIFFW